jgi:ABC-2 type transport system ATP-binding protein
MSAIEILGLEKTYSVGFWRKQPKCALKPLHLAVEEGEVFGFLGPNGAGKTTTLKLLMGLMYPTAGSARILGMEIGDPRMKAQIGFLPEQPYFYDYLTVRELLDYYGKLSGVPATELARGIDVVLDRVGLADAADVQLRKFSKGMLQRAGIAQAILHDPKVVFLDEPMSGLDPMGRREVRDLIVQLKQEKKTIFFSTHILSDAEALCDRVAVLQQGELRGLGTVADLTARTQGKLEIVWQGTPLPSALKALGVAAQISGNTARAEVQSSQLDLILDALRGERCRLISVNPVHGTLEEYFLEQMNLPGPGAGNHSSQKGASA